MCQLFDLSWNTHTVILISKLQESLFIWSPYVFDVAENQKLSLTSENGHYK